VDHQLLGIPASAAKALARARETRAELLALRERSRRALVRAVHLLTRAGVTRRAAAEALGITCGAVQHALAEPCPAPNPEPQEPTTGKRAEPAKEVVGADSRDGRGRTQLLRHRRTLPDCEASRVAAIQLHERTLMALTTDARCCFEALPVGHPHKRIMAARARLEKAALVLDDDRLKELEKPASRLLREQAKEKERGEGIRVMVDLSTCGVPRGHWPVYGDISVGSRETAANDVLEQLRDSVLDYADDEVEHVIRANDGHSKPIRYNRTFGPEQFIELAPKLATQLNRQYVARTDRADADPLLATSDLDSEKQERLRREFTQWRGSHRAADVTRDDLATLLRGMLRALGATKDAAKHLFDADYARERRRDERAERSGTGGNRELG
jgi:hypothetical protein